jgi:murein DD-endopeptidase MepM/ murein hydrolase activator NlpD
MTLRKLLLLAALLLAGLPLLGNPTQIALTAQITGTPAPTPSPRPFTTIHVVQRGETLFKIALLYGSSVEAIARANGITDVSRIQVGQRLIIPNAQPGTGILANAPGTVIEYTLGLTDSLPLLAARFGTSRDSIAQQNHILNPDAIYAGLSLQIQVGSEGRTLHDTGMFYTIQPDDTLQKIAVRFNLSVSTLQALNHLPEYARLYPGQTLYIPSIQSLNDLPDGLSALGLLPTSPQQGRTLLLSLTLSTPATPTATFLDKEVVWISEDRRTYKAWVGVPAMLAPGVYPFALTLTGADNGKQTLTRRIFINDGGYYAERITLPADQLDLLDPKVTEPELQQVLALVAPVTPKRYLLAPLGLPVAAAVTSQYGTRRSYNGGPFDQFHTGTDFMGSIGAPIYAPAPGKVIFTGALYVRGNATIIDHGWGIYTGYWHQSEFLVKVGDEVVAGQLIGKIGNTGRVTGPHLHWELFVNGVQVDPLQWVRAGLQ